MKKGFIVFLFLCLFGFGSLPAQDAGGKTYRYQLETAPFPHVKRANGYSYKEKLYDAAEHYSDSSVLVYVPSVFKPDEPTDIVVYFHGWHNSIDTANLKFKLFEQFASSGLNALLVCPEAAKFAPDSFGGKLEEKSGFSKFIAELFAKLKNDGIIHDAKPGNIVLAGHSGAYRVIAYILFRGGLTENISTVFLFDALYGETEKYIHWLESGDKKFINIYTKDGGTKTESEILIEDLDEWNRPYFKTEDDAISAAELQKNRIVFISSKLSHNEVVEKNKQFQKFLESIKK
ncbi:MAG: hypothetical protein HYV28_19890 [Ignavibacteriales bacterium]|nr:hypothetical protein [Ignavibacteriales bacterium]